MSELDTRSSDISDRVRYNLAVPEPALVRVAATVRSKESTYERDLIRPVFSESRKYFNLTGHDVTFVLRDGQQIESESDRWVESEPAVVIYEEYNLFGHSVRSFARFLLNLDRDAPTELIQFAQIFKQVYTPGNNSVFIPIEYRIPYRTIRNSGGSVYVPELDIILTTRKDNIPLHPRSKYAEDKRLYESNSSPFYPELIYRGGSPITRVLRFADHQVQIRSKSGGTKPEGLHLYFTGTGDANSPLGSNQHKHYTLEEMDQLGFVFLNSTTAEMAASDSDSAKLNLQKAQAEIQRLQHEAAREKANNDREKALFEREKHKLDMHASQENARLADRERDLKERELILSRYVAEKDQQMKLDRMRENDYYESRSATRKNSTEIIKTVPALILGAGAIIATLIKVLIK